MKEQNAGHEIEEKQEKRGEGSEVRDTGLQKTNTIRLKETSFFL